MDANIASTDIQDSWFMDVKRNENKIIGIYGICVHPTGNDIVSCS